MEYFRRLFGRSLAGRPLHGRNLDGTSPAPQQGGKPAPGVDGGGGVGSPIGILLAVTKAS